MNDRNKSAHLIIGSLIATRKYHPIIKTSIFILVKEVVENVRMDNFFNFLDLRFSLPEFLSFTL